MESSTFFMSAIIAFLAYLIGSVPFALVIGKGFYKTDVRKHGSGNLGATNTFRALGKKEGIIVMVGDMAKGSLANLSTSYFGQQLTYAYPWLHCNSRT